VRLAVWHGTEAQLLALLEAVEANCACARGKNGERRSSCSAHLMLVGDQRALDGLVFVSRLASELQRQEWESSGVLSSC
jgi:hypothetical protein